MNTRIEIPPYALKRMVNRRIGEHQVRSVLDHPDRRYPSREGRMVAERDTESGNIVRVVYVERVEGGERVLTVVTVVRMAP